MCCQVAHLHGVPFLALKAITDIVDGERPAQEEFLENLHMAAQALQVKEVILYVYHFLSWAQLLLSATISVRGHAAAVGLLSRQPCEDCHCDLLVRTGCDVPCGRVCGGQAHQGLVMRAPGLLWHEMALPAWNYAHLCSASDIGLHPDLNDAFLPTNVNWCVVLPPWRCMLASLTLSCQHSQPRNLQPICIMEQ